MFGVPIVPIGRSHLLVGATDADFGAPGAGAAYLFTTNWTLAATFTNPAPGELALFGFAAAAVGEDRLLIASTMGYSGGTGNSAVYLFSTNGTLLTTFTSPTLSTNFFQGDGFGASVAVLGTNCLAIAAPNALSGSLGTGALHLFGTNGQLIATINNPGGFGALDQSRFGYRMVPFGNDRLLASATAYDRTSNQYMGIVYLLSTNGTLLMTYTNSSPGQFDSFGQSLAAVGTGAVLIGAPYNSVSATNSGAAYLFATNGFLMATIAKPGVQAYGHFGEGLAALGSDRMLIAAITQNPTNNSAVGETYLFSTNGMLLTTFTNPAPWVYDSFGRSIMVADSSRVLIGALQAGRDGAYGEGVVHAFDTNGNHQASLLRPTPTFANGLGTALAAVGSDRILVGAPGSRAAYVMSTNGMVLSVITNADPKAGLFGTAVTVVGNDSLVVSAPAESTQFRDAGEVYLYSTNGTLRQKIPNPVPGLYDRFGSSLAAMGNDRFIVGRSLNSISVDSGSVYLFSTNGVVLTSITNSFGPPSQFGLAVASVADTFILVGAPGSDAAFLFTTNGVVVTNFFSSAPRFGQAVAALGTDRVIIAAPAFAFFGSTNVESGGVFIYSTNGALLTTITNPNPAALDRFGGSVAAVGTDRVLVGAYQAGQDGNEAGAAYLFGTNGMLIGTFRRTNPKPFDRFGASVAAMGAGHVLVGAPNDSLAAPNSGAAYLFTAPSVNPPVITSQPQGRVTPATNTLTLNVAASGTGLLYQWRKDGSNIAGAMSPTLTLSNVVRSTGGAYSVVVSGGGTDIASSNGIVRIIVPQRFHRSERLGSGHFRLRFGDSDGGTLTTNDLTGFEIWGSTNLLDAGAWMRVTNGIILTNGQAQVDDIDAAVVSRRFYRVVER